MLFPKYFNIRSFVKKQEAVSKCLMVERTNLSMQMESLRREGKDNDGELVIIPQALSTQSRDTARRVPTIRGRQRLCVNSKRGRVNWRGLLV